MVDGKVVFLPRVTTLVGASSGIAEFTTAPLDVSQQGGVQFQVWRGPSTGTVKVYLQESLDGQEWVLGPSTPTGYELTAGEAKFFSYGFRLRWFRLKVEVTVVSSSWPKVTMWAEGLLRAGGSGVWPAAAGPASGALMGGAVPAGGIMPPGSAAASGRPSWDEQFYAQSMQMMQRAMDDFIRNASRTGR
jgi:hypothetical protein